MDRRCLGLPFVRKVVVKDAGVCKRCQTETTCALLGKVGSADPAGVRYLATISKPFTWVQSVEPCTAKVTKRALEKVMTPSEMSSAFPLRSRLAICDKASSNLLGEKTIQRDRGPRSAAGRHGKGKTASLVVETSQGCSTWPWRVGWWDA